MADEPKDPVCGMSLSRESAEVKLEYKGQTYYFCCSGCMKRFLREPERYMKKVEVAGHH